MEVVVHLNNMQTIDIAIIETLNGGDAQLKGNDLGVVYGIENMIYLALFGGNLESSTEALTVEKFSKDFWGNNLFLKDTPNSQFNSLTERTINSVPLTSSGRNQIQNAITEDLKFFSDLGATVEVIVNIISDDKLSVKITVKLNPSSEKIVIINFKKTADGDFFAPDFDLSDFYI